MPHAPHPSSPSSSSLLTKERALEILASIAEHGDKDSDRLAALRMAGSWSGWDAGTDADPDDPSVSADAETIMAGIRALTKRGVSGN